jgi:predicted nucleic acid-binding protein
LIVDALTAGGRFMREPRASHWANFRELSTLVDLRGNLVPDALLAATCMDFGGSILTAARDFLNFPDLRVHLITSSAAMDYIPDKGRSPSQL